MQSDTLLEHDVSHHVKLYDGTSTFQRCGYTSIYFRSIASGQQVFYPAVPLRTSAAVLDLLVEMSDQRRFYGNPKRMP